MNRLAVLGGVVALGLGLAGCATTGTATVRIPDTAASTSSPAAAPSLAGPVPQDPNPHGVTLAHADGASALGSLREGVPTPGPGQQYDREPLMAGPTPQVPIPVFGPVPQDPNPHGVVSRPSATTAAARADGTPTPEPATRSGHRGGPLPTTADVADLHVAGPVPQDPNPNGGARGGWEPTFASHEVAPRAEPAPHENRPAAASREFMPVRGRASSF